MHPYATDSKERRTVIVILAAASILAAWILNKNFTFSWWVDTPAVFGFFGAFFLLFDNYLWKFFRKIRVLNVPNLNGEWTGYLKSSHDNFQKELPATMVIRQTWTNMTVILRSDTSRSKSVIASLIIGAGDCPVLSYSYRSEPKPDAVTTMHMHDGTTRLFVESGEKKLSGEYYTGRDRKNFGEMHFAKSNG